MMMMGVEGGGGEERRPVVVEGQWEGLALPPDCQSLPTERGRLGCGSGSVMRVVLSPEDEDGKSFLLHISHDLVLRGRNMLTQKHSMKLIDCLANLCKKKKKNHP